MTTIVTTQEELDAAIEGREESIVIDSTPGVRLQLRGSSHAEAWGSSCVDAWDDSSVEAWGYSHVTVWDSAHVHLRSTTATATVGGHFGPPARS